VIKLKRLKINRYRNVEPCDLVFGDRFNILLGPNGAGKTTLLSLISKVLRTNLTDASDPFSIEVELSFADGSLSGKIESFEEARAVSDDLPLALRVEGAGWPRASQAQRVPHFEFQIRRVDPPSVIDVSRTDTEITIAANGVSQPGKRPLMLLEFASVLLNEVMRLVRFTSHPASYFRAEEIENVGRFDESLDAFRALTARQDDISVVGAEFRPHLRYIKINEKKSPTRPNLAYSHDSIVPASLTHLLQKRFTGKTTEFSFNDNDLRFLSESCRLLGLRSSTAKLELTGKRTNEGLEADVYEFGNLKFWFTRKNGDIFQDQHLSYGQKRLLTFLYYLECNPSIVIADELVNGLHHAWIKECMEAIGERQAFLTSQNPLLLDYLFFTSVQEVKESFILCRTEAVGNSEKMIWRNLTDDEAAMFYSAYKVGIEHVGEILRTRGLW
jgi:energy-coupling factor transporter ATP-binding protein EcfA2